MLSELEPVCVEPVLDAQVDSSKVLQDGFSQRLEISPQA